MMRFRTVTFAVMAFVVLFFGCSELIAGPCPSRADSLEDFAPCMQPMVGTIGMRSAGGVVNMADKHHGQVIRAMHGGPIVPPQVVQRPAVYPFYGPLVFGYAYHRSGAPLSNWWMMNYLFWLSH
jgi:hypothetical protein